MHGDLSCACVARSRGQETFRLREDMLLGTMDADVATGR
jgi:hypothetical protein